MSIIGNPLIIGDSGGGGGGGIAIIDTTDVHGGTIREIQAVESVQGTQTKTISGSGISYVTPSSGYDAMARVQITTPSGTLATPTINTGTGVVTASVSTAGYIPTGTSSQKTLSLTTQAAQTLYPSTSDQTVSSGAYLTGTQTFKGVLLTNLTADNIKQGVVVKVGDSADDDRITAITGTYAGGGGGMGTLLGTLAVGTISTSSTTDTDTGKSITVKGIYNYDLLICECSVNTKTNGRHACTSRLCWLTAGTTIGTKNGATFATATWNVKLSSSGTATSRSNTTSYGVYAKAATVSAGSTGDNGQAVITIYRRYNNTQTGTINGTYTMRVYGINLYDLIGG